MLSTEANIEAFLAKLNDAQREAVTTVHGPVLVVAGAGSGKTRVITYRIPYLLLTGEARPDQILALTFTNKAAGEMKARAAALAGETFRPPYISTFHSFGALFLRRHIQSIGYSRDFLIYDEDDQLGLVKECCRQLGLGETRYNPRDVQQFVKWHKMKAEGAEIYDPNVQNVIDLYGRKIRASQAVDFDDLLLLPLKILREHPEILQRYVEAYRFLMVDEYQDTNEVQYELLKVLAGPRANLLVVGDEDQSIYRFRGAKPENIAQFRKDFPNHRLVKLEQNYRSTKTIIKAAQAVISRNSSNVKKELWTENAPGEPIEVYHATDEYDEATFVTLRVMAALKESTPGEIGILYRANAQSRAIEESFIKAAIPHRIVGAVSFYERREIKDALGFLRMLANPEDQAGFFRVLNVPPRGAGKKMIQSIREDVQNGMRPFEAALRHGGPALRSFLDLFQPSLATVTPSIFLEDLLRRIGYLDYLKKEDPLTAEDRMENIAELLAFLREKEADPDFHLAEFLSSLPLNSGTREEPSEAVTLLTVHSAKGLEYKVLFVVGMEEGLFPHIRSLESSEDVEEERRLLYVAMTRAKEKLTLSWAQRRGMFGTSNSNRPSRFLEEIPAWFKVTHISERFGSAEPRREPSASATSSARRDEPSSPYRVGSIVRHDKLGRGSVIRVEGVPDDWKVTIRFPSGTKTIMTKYAQLTVE